MTMLQNLFEYSLSVFILKCLHIIRQLLLMPDFILLSSFVFTARIHLAVFDV